MKNYIKYLSANHLTDYYPFNGKIYDIVIFDKCCIISVYICKNEIASHCCSYIKPNNSDELYYNNKAYRTMTDLKNLKCLVEYDKTIKAIDTLT